MEKRVRPAWVKVLWVLGAAAAGWLFIRFLLPCLLPFILAFLTAAVCEPVAEFLSERCHLRRAVASALCVLVILASVLGFFLLVVVRLLDEAVGLLEELPRLAEGLPQVFERVELALSRFVEAMPEGTRGYIRDASAAISGKAAQIPAALSEWALQKLRDAAAGAPGTVLGVATYVIGSFFISSGFGSVKAFLVRQIPVSARETARNIKEDLIDSLGKWLRAEAALLGITFAELTAAFTVMGVNYGAVIALATALIDALPVFGSGAVLLPWAAVCLISGASKRGWGLLITYAVVTVVHSCLEPKLIGDRFGVSPAAALLAMYTGFKLTGVTGMVVFPFALMVLNRMNTKGYVKLWKQAEK